MTRILTLTMAIALATGSAFAQTNSTSNNTGSGATNTNNAGTTTSAQDASGGTASKSGKHKSSHKIAHKTAHHDAAMHHEAQRGQQAMDRGDVAYRKDLRQCVEGPTNNRDACLDQAIAHHRRS